MRKAGLSIVVVLLCIFCVFQSFMFYGQGRTDSSVIVSITTTKDEISAGSAAEFDLTFNVSGAKTSYQNVFITIDLPEETNLLSKDNLAELNIFGVVPEYVTGKNNLKYSFPNLVGGNIASLKLWLGTTNATSPDGTKKEVKVTVKVGNEEYRDTAEVTLRASGKVATNIYCDFEKSDISLKSDRIGRYTVRVQVPKFGESGDLAVDANKKIDVFVMYDKVLELTYESSSHNGTLGTPPGSNYSGYDAILWSLDPSEFMEDEDGHLYAELTYEVKYPLLTAPEERALEFWLQATVPFIGDSYLTSDWRSCVHSIFNNITLTGSGPQQIIIYDGNSYNNISSGHFPSMYVGDTFRTLYGLNSWPLEDGAVVKSFQFEEPINPERIQWNSIYTGDFKILDATVKIPMTGMTVSLLLDPDENTWATVPTGADKTLTRADFAISNEQKVYALRIEMLNEVPSFGMSPWIESRYTVVGEIPATEETYEQTSEYSVYFKTPDMQYHIGGMKYKNGLLKYYGIDENEIFSPVGWGYFKSGIKIQPEPPGSPTGKVSLRLIEPVSSMIEDGQYTLEYQFENLKVSSELGEEGYIKNPMGAVLLPKEATVELLSESLNGSMQVVDNYDGDRQLLIFKFAEKSMKPNASVAATVKINIAVKSNNPALDFEVYGLYDNSVMREPNVTIADLVEDSSVVPNSLSAVTGNTNENMLSAGKDYVYGYKAGLHTEIRVKGSYDADYSLIGLSKEDKEVDYQLVVENRYNRTLSDVVLMNILPALDDVGVTGVYNRDSLWSTELTGPVRVPSGYTVRYSKSNNPDRTELFANAVYPTGTDISGIMPTGETPNWLTETQVGTDWAEIQSFIVTSDSGTIFRMGEEIIIDYSVKVGTDFVYQQTESDAEKNFTDALSYQTKANESKDTVKAISDMIGDVNVDLHPAWNSFAVQAGDMEVTEAMRAGLLIVDSRRLLTGEIKGVKKVVGNNAPEEEFIFAATKLDENDEPTTKIFDVTRKGAGEFTIDLGILPSGTHRFEVSEKKAEINGWVYDAKTYLVEVEVTYDSNKEEYDISYSGTENIEFMNRYTKFSPQTMIPKTGGSLYVLIWLVLSFVSIIGMIIIYRKKAIVK